ncbi:hypothetical protein K5X82_17265 [Halosquirtibacter xylanolyticus]|uniref:hypothetical protein n=1 Tax=Halosquirtibacter xylanolyticus TaxID=3374599 RepID=UPI0037490795|nr:hypothetical protein K5X82_17265 [Prolixibacteraceae bacterium]
MKNFNYTLGLFLLLFSGQTVFANVNIAQGDTTKIGFSKSFEFESQRKVVEKVQKIMDEPEPQKVPEKPKVEYDIKGAPIEDNVSLAKLKPAEMELPTYEHAGNGFLRAGMGTYLSPLFELMYNNKNASKRLFGVHLLHESQFADQKLESGQKVNAPHANTNIDLSSRFYLKRSVLGVNLGYGNIYDTYYGYVGEVPTSLIDGKDNTYNYGDKLSQNNVSAGLTYKTDRSEDKISINANFDYQYFKTNYKQSENNIGLNLGLMKKFNKLYGGIDMALQYDQLNSVLQSKPDSSANDFYFRFVPKVSFRNEKIIGTVGLGVDASFDSGFGNTVVVYPEIDIQYDMLKGYMTWYANMTGSVQNNDYYKMVAENTYMYDGQRIEDAKQQIKAAVGAKGLFLSVLSYDIFAEYEMLKNDHYWGMQKHVDGKNVVYDNRFRAFYQDVNCLTLGLKLNAVLSKKTFVTAGVMYHHYNLDKDSLFYKPQVTFNIDGGYKITPRLSMSSTLRFIGAQKGMVYSVDDKNKVVVDTKLPEIKSFVNLGIGAKYELPYNLVTFCQFNNLLNQRYQEWIGYNQNGFEFKLGLTWNF